MALSATSAETALALGRAQNGVNEGGCDDMGARVEARAGGAADGNDRSCAVGYQILLVNSYRN